MPFEGGLLAIAKTDPSISKTKQLLEIWQGLDTATDGSDATAWQPLPSGFTGQEVRNLFLANMPDLQGLDDPACRYSVSAGFRIRSKDLKLDTAWHPTEDFPKEGPLTGGTLGSHLPAKSVIESRRDSVAPDLFIYSPSSIGDPARYSQAVGKATSLYLKCRADSSEAAQSAFRRLFVDLLSRDKHSELYELSKQPLKYQDMPSDVRKQITAKLTNAPDRYGFSSPKAAYEATRSGPSVSLQPYLTFSISVRQPNGEYMGFSVSIVAPAYQEIRP